VQRLDSWSYATAYRWLERQVTYGVLLMLGLLNDRDRKPQKVYGKKTKIDHLRHSVEISRILAHFEMEGWPWRRGAEVNDRFRADADLKQYGQTFRLEVDLDHERRRALERRLSVYRNCDDFVLFVCPTERRIREVKEVGEFLGNQLLITSIAKASKDPFAKNTWEDIHGNKCSL
jgi:hypothetical protein